MVLNLADNAAKVRRLYDIANVLSSLSLIEKVITLPIICSAQLATSSCIKIPVPEFREIVDNAVFSSIYSGNSASSVPR